MADQSGLMIPKTLKKYWESVATIIIENAIEVIDDETTEVGAVKYALKLYLATRDPDATIDDVYEAKDPYYDGVYDYWYFWKDKFFRWMKTHINTDMDHRTFMVTLHRLKCKSKQVHFTYDGKRTTTNVWMTPSGMI